MRVRFWHIVVFALALVVFAIASIPAALVLPQRPGSLTYARADGTIWRGSLEDVQLGGYQARRASWSISPLDVIQGKAIAPIDLEEGSMEGRVILLGNWHGDRRIAIPQLRLDGAAVTGALRLPGETRFHGVDVLFEDGSCTRAQGRIESDVLLRAGQVLNWSGPSVSGTARCEGEYARIHMMGANELGERVNVRIMLRADGSASWRVSVQTERPDTVDALAGAGFSRSAADGSLGHGEDTRWLP
jgi:hypothetical protein